jgi:hypothetical protein
VDGHLPLLFFLIEIPPFLLPQHEDHRRPSWNP